MTGSKIIQILVIENMLTGARVFWLATITSLKRLIEKVS